MKIWVEIEKGVEVQLCDKCSALLFNGILPPIGCPDCVELMMQEALRKQENKQRKKRKS
jgi:hypothetical protein